MSKSRVLLSAAHEVSHVQRACIRRLTQKAETLETENRNLRRVADLAHVLLREARSDLSLAGNYCAWIHDSTADLVSALKTAGYEGIEPF